LSWNWSQVLREAADRVKERVDRLFGTLEAREVLGVGAGGDLTKRIDRVAEEAIIEVLDRNNVSCTLVSEEIGFKTLGEKSDLYVVVDPVDGTSNAIHGLDFYATSIAISDKATLSGVFQGIVMDLNSGSVFTAEKGKGAYRDGKPIRVSDHASFKESLAGLDLNGVDEAQLRKVYPLIMNFRHLRHFGASALELCYVAAGLIDVYIDLREKIRVTDLAAGYLIVKEAGGVTLTTKGDEVDIPLAPQSRATIIAGNQSICKLILGTITK
jgi:myo-inositol-1(or 4)-monophosphatase